MKRVASVKRVASAEWVADVLVEWKRMLSSQQLMP